LAKPGKRNRKRQQVTGQAEPLQQQQAGKGKRRLSRAASTPFKVANSQYSKEAREQNGEKPPRAGLGLHYF
jgi:hypothetical protein